MGLIANNNLTNYQIIKSEKESSHRPRTEAFAFLNDQFKTFSVETQNKMQQDRNEGYIIPKRRVCGFGLLASASKIWEAEHTKFIAQSDIVGAPHEMRFLRSPYKIESEEVIEEMREFVKNRPHFQYMIDEAYKNNEKLAKAIGVTKEGRHVILQQAVASCVPTSVAMIVLDHGGTPDYDSIRDTHFSNVEGAMNWFEVAGFSVKSTSLSGTNRVRTLIQCLKENGPGVLFIHSEEIGGHAIVLDAISIEDGMATIRDPYHGWCIDIKLGTLEKMIGSSFIQITGKK